MADEEMLMKKRVTIINETENDTTLEMNDCSMNERLVEKRMFSMVTNEGRRNE